MTQQDFVMVADVPQRDRRKQAAVKYALVVAIFIILAVAYYYSFRRFARSSDDANILLAGHEMSKGNWRLKGWWLPEDNFLTTHVLLYAILVKCIVQYFFQLFGCDFFGKDVFAISINGPALSLIRLPFLVLLIAALVHVGKRFFASIKVTDRLWPVVEGDYLDALLADCCDPETDLKARLQG